MSRRRRRLGLSAALTLAVIAAGCGGDGGEAEAVRLGSSLQEIRKLAQEEGQVNLVSPAGYVEDGSTDPTVDWVTPFERRTGCRVRNTIGDTSGEMLSLMSTGDHDVVAAAGDATLRLIERGDVAPVDTSLIPNYADVFAGLKNKPHNSVGEQMYGVPHGRGANVLMWRTDVVDPAPDSWGAVFDADSPYAGKVTAYDSPITIADAALYLKATRPELGIENVYELDDAQFQAATGLLEEQKLIVGEYWSNYTYELAAFTSGDSVIGTTWQLTKNLLDAQKVPVAVTLPKEGATGWSDTWMISSRAQHPSCAYLWLDWIISPKVNAQVSEWFGEAPSNAKACALTVDENHCDTHHAADEDYFSRVAYWTRPEQDCGDDRGAVCKDYSEWLKAWRKIRG